MGGSLVAALALAVVSAGVGEGAHRSNAGSAADFRGTAEMWYEPRTQLSRLEPPEEARSEFEELLTALEGGVADLRAAARAARSSDPEAFREARESLSESSEDINAADNALKDAVESD